MQRILAIMAAVGCLLALFDMPSEYYKVLRFVVVAACVFAIVEVRRLTISDGRKNALTTVFGMVAVVFNPLLPVELERETWVYVDSFTAALFLGYEFRRRVIAFWGKAAKQREEKRNRPYSSKDLDEYKQGYNDLAHARGVLESTAYKDREQVSDLIIKASWNMQFYCWAFSERATDRQSLSARYLDASPALQRRAFGEEIGEGVLFERTQAALNQLKGSKLQLGELVIDVNESSLYQRWIDNEPPSRKSELQRLAASAEAEKQRQLHAVEREMKESAKTAPQSALPASHPMSGAQQTGHLMLLWMKWTVIFYPLMVPFTIYHEYREGGPLFGIIATGLAAPFIVSLSVFMLFYALSIIGEGLIASVSSWFRKTKKPT
jgi:hypothetical protein